MITVARCAASVTASHVDVWRSRHKNMVLFDYIYVAFASGFKIYGEDITGGVHFATLYAALSSKLLMNVKTFSFFVNYSKDECKLHIC